MSDAAPYVAVAADPPLNDQESLREEPELPMDHAAAFTTLIPLATIALLLVVAVAREVVCDVDLSPATIAVRQP
jgi:hypothetical protein